MANFCPKCKGLMYSRAGNYECSRCSVENRARTIITPRGQRHIPQGQSNLAARPIEAGFDLPLQPEQLSWNATVGGKPDPKYGLFPYDEIRPSQEGFTRDVTMAVSTGKHLVAHAPTGIGKTAAALAPALKQALDTGKTVFFLTSRQSQHRIAVDTLREIQSARGVKLRVVDLVGKRDMCLRTEIITMHPSGFPNFCATETRTKSCKYATDVPEDAVAALDGKIMHAEEIMYIGRMHEICPHKLAMTAAQDADVVIADYNHLFSDIRSISLERLGMTLDDVILIVDEAHNLPDRIRRSHQHQISTFKLDSVRQEAKRCNLAEVIADTEALEAALDSIAKHAREANAFTSESKGGVTQQIVKLEIPDLVAAFESNRNRLVAGRTMEDFIKSLGVLTGEVRKSQDDPPAAESLHAALRDWDRFSTGALRYLELDGDGSIRLNVALLDPSIPARGVFDQVASAILMSGTLKPLEATRDLLGLKEDRTKLKEYASPFPPEHKAICVFTDVTSRSSKRDDGMYLRMANYIVELASVLKGNMAVFAPSYATLNELRRACNEIGFNKHAIIEESSLSKGEKELILDDLRGRKERGGAILFAVMGGSFSEGVDFPDNLLASVVISGLPLAPPDLEVKSMIGYLERRFPGRGNLYGYTVPAMNKVLQSMGRGIRSSNDQCVYLLLEDRFLQPQYRQFLPDEPKPVSGLGALDYAKRFARKWDL